MARNRCPYPQLQSKQAQQRAHVTEIIPNLNLLLTSLVYQALLRVSDLQTAAKPQSLSASLDCHHSSPTHFEDRSSSLIQVSRILPECELPNQPLQGYITPYNYAMYPALHQNKTLASSCIVELAFSAMLSALLRSPDFSPITNTVIEGP